MQITITAAATTPTTMVSVVVVEVINGIFGSKCNGHMFSPNKIDGVSRRVRVFGVRCIACCCCFCGFYSNSRFGFFFCFVCTTLASSVLCRMQVLTFFRFHLIWFFIHVVGPCGSHCSPHSHTQCMLAYSCRRIKFCRSHAIRFGFSSLGTSNMPEQFQHNLWFLSLCRFSFVFISNFPRSLLCARNVRVYLLQ